MINTRFMDRLFSATDEKDAELTEQVAKDIEDAKANGSVDTEELKYENQGDGKVAITDKENGEVTIAEKAEDGNYDLYPAEQTQQIEGFIHPEGDGVTPGQQVGAPDEKVENHLDGSSVISPNLPDGGLNPEAGNERSVEDVANCPECDDEKSFSVYSDNTVVQRIFSDQEFCERVFSEVVESEETAKVGDLKVEKVDDNAVIVTDETTGDQAKITLDNDEMEVTELDSKNFSDDDEDEYEDEQFDALHVVGVDAGNHVIVDAPEYDVESAQELAARLSEQGVDGCQIFDNSEEARDYAINLLANLGVESAEDIEEPEEATFSDVDGYEHPVYAQKYYSSNTIYMDRLFSETANDIDASQSEIEDAIENGDQIENDSEVITPIDSKSAVIKDKENGEFTKVTIDDDKLDFSPISEKEAEELTDHLEVAEEEEDENEKKFSDVYSNEEETKFFSEDEPMTDYMIRLFSEESDEKVIEDAIENGDQIENETEVITPIDSKTAVVEDKENGEFTKAVMDDDSLDLTPISEDEADKLTEGLEVEDTDEDEDEKKFSDVYSNEEETKFFSEEEPMTNYMVRLFSEESDEKAIEDAIENGDQIENETEVITPVDSKTAVIEDKDNGEFTKAVMDDDKLDLTPISEDEANELTEDLKVEDTDKDEDAEKDEKKFSYSEDAILDKFFADAIAGQAAQAQATPVVPVQNTVPVVAEPVAEEPAPSVEAIEDKAVAAIQSIQAAAAEAEATILNAKAAPVEGQEADLQEAQFSEAEEQTEVEEKTFSDNEDTLVSWLSGTGYKK